MLLMQRGSFTAAALQTETKFGRLLSLQERLQCFLKLYSKAGTIGSGMRFRFDSFVLVCEERVLWRDGEIVPLAPKALETLRLLLEKSGSVVSKQEFMETLWPQSFVEEANLTQTIFVLRKALGASPSGRPYIETIPKRGYRFSGAIAAEPENHSPAPVHTEGPAAVISVEGESKDLRGGLPSPEAAARVSHGRPWLPLLLTLGAVLLGMLAAQAIVAIAREPIKVGEYKRLTNDAGAKEMPACTTTIVTDGRYIFFPEIQENKSVLGQVSVTGGEVAYGPVPYRNAVVADLSPDGRQLLFGTTWQVDGKMPLMRGEIATNRFAPVFDVRAHDATWSPDGKELAYAQFGNVFVRSANGTSKEIAEVKGTAYWLRWSSDGGFLRFSNNYEGNHNQLWEVAKDGTNLHPLFTRSDDAEQVCCGSWSKSGRSFLYLSTRTNTMHIQVEHPGLWQRWLPARLDIPAGPLDKWLSPIPSPDGKHVFAIGGQLRGQLVRINPATRQPEPFLGGLSAEGLQFSPDRMRLVWTSYPDGTLWTSSTDGSAKVQLTDPPLLARFPRWSPDGKTIAFIAAQPGRNWQLYTVPAAGGAVTPLKPEKDGQGVASWSPDGHLLSFGHILDFSAARAHAPMIEMLRLADRQTTTVPGSEGLWIARWSPDGHFLSAVTTDRSTLRLYDMEAKTWTDLAHVAVNDAAWSPDSRYLFFDTAYGTDPVLYRARMQDRKVEPWANLQNVRRAGFYAPWLGMAPDGAPMLLEDTSIQELYSIAVNLP